MIDVISNILIFIGLILIITAVVGCYRLPDFFTKMHAATIGDAVGCPLMLIGISLKATTFLLGIKIILLAFIMLIINPTASYILNRFALKQGIPPEIKENKNV